MADVDWQAVRLAYVRGRIKSYKKLAEKYGISLDTLSKRAKREGWFEQRKKYAASVAKKAEARAKEQDSKRLAALQNAGSEMCSQIEAIMQDAKRELHTHITDKGEAVEADAVNDKKVYNLARAIETMTRAMRNLYDIQTGAEAAQLEMARQEMALKEREQERRERADGEKGQAQQITITYQGVDSMEAYHE